MKRVRVNTYGISELICKRQLNQDISWMSPVIEHLTYIQDHIWYLFRSTDTFKLGQVHVHFLQCAMFSRISEIEIASIKRSPLGWLILKAPPWAIWIGSASMIWYVSRWLVMQNSSVDRSMISDAKFICWPLPPLNVCFTKRYTYLRVIKILIPPWLHTSVQSWRNIFLIVRNVGPSIDLVKISAKFIFMSTCRALMRLWFSRHVEPWWDYDSWEFVLNADVDQC